MNKSIHQIAADVLARAKKPMTADEIYEIIASEGLYEFKAKSAKSVLRNQIRRHCSNVDGVHQATTAIFEMLPDGRFNLILR
jgi:hypothetical protein